MVCFLNFSARALVTIIPAAFEYSFDLKRVIRSNFHDLQLLLKAIPSCQEAVFSLTFKFPELPATITTLNRFAHKQTFIIKVLSTG